jgi:hypothetical protein
MVKRLIGATSTPLKRRLAKSGRGNLLRECLHGIPDELMTARPLHTQGAVYHSRVTSKPLTYLFLQAVRIGGLDDHDIPPDAPLEEGVTFLSV